MERYPVQSEVEKPKLDPEGKGNVPCRGFPAWYGRAQWGKRLEQIILKYIWNHKRQYCQNNPQGRRGGIKAGGITLPDFRKYYKATVIKTV